MPSARKEPGVSSLAIASSKSKPLRNTAAAMSSKEDLHEGRNDTSPLRFRPTYSVNKQGDVYIRE